MKDKVATIVNVTEDGCEVVKEEGRVKRFFDGIASHWRLIAEVTGAIIIGCTAFSIGVNYCSDEDNNDLDLTSDIFEDNGTEKEA